MFQPESGLASMQCPFSAPRTSHRCAFTHNHSRELLGTATTSDCGLFTAPAEQLGGVKGIATVAVERQIGILVIQTFLIGRAAPEAEIMSSVELNLSAGARKVYLYSNFPQKYI